MYLSTTLFALAAAVGLINAAAIPLTDAEAVCPPLPLFPSLPLTPMRPTDTRSTTSVSSITYKYSATLPPPPEPYNAPAARTSHTPYPPVTVPTNLPVAVRQPSSPQDCWTPPAMVAQMLCHTTTARWHYATGSRTTRP